MTDFEDWLTGLAAQPGPGEARLDQLRAGGGIEDLTEAEAAEWVLQALADYRREPIGWRAHVLVGRAAPECTGSVPAGRRFQDAVVAVMDQAQALADATRRPVRVIHGVHGRPDRFLPTLRKSGVDVGAFASPVLAALPAPARPAEGTA